jgi:uncharacterized delta-60 repeat protein
MTAPVLDTSASPSLPSILEGATNPAGITIADLVVDGSITDPDGTAVEAIAITGLDTSLGAWQYSLDSGTTWLTIQAEQINSTTNELALLLGPTAMVRLLPFGNLNGTLNDAITFRAWDESWGSAGKYVLITNTGGNTAFSAETDTVSSTVTAIDPGGVPATQRGTVLTDFGSQSYEVAYSVAMQADGKFVVVGVTDASGANAAALARYNADGSLDSTFNGAGDVIAHFGGQNDWGLTTAVQPDGKILVAGSSGASAGIARYNIDGSLDATFNGGGVVVNNSVFGQSLALQPDGKIIVAGFAFAGSYDFALLRFNVDGTLDSTFNGTGRVLTDFGGTSDIALQLIALPDGKILALGRNSVNSSYSLELARYNSDGSLDTTFNGTGKLVTNIGSDGSGQCVAVQPDGRILVGGVSHSNGFADFEVARYHTDGSVDTSFGAAGKVVTDMGSNRPDEIGNLTVQSDGKILAVGTTDVDGTWNCAVVRYNPDGSLDSTFNETGKVSIDIGNHSNDAAYSVTVQPDGKIVIAGSSNANGSSDFAVARLNPDGSLDTTFGTTNYFSYAPGGAPIPLDNRVAVYDHTLAALNGGMGDYSGASLSLYREGGAVGEDVFSALGELSFADGTVIFSGVTVGTVTNTGGLLTITFNHNATQVRVNGVISHIGYSDSSETLPPYVVIDYGLAHGTSSSGVQFASLAAPVVGTVSVHMSNADIPPTGSVTISGVPAWGRILAASNTLADADGMGAISYQWFADGTPIAGATNSTFTLTADQVGAVMTVSANFTDLLAHVESVTSAGTSAVQPSAPLIGSAGNDTLEGGGGNDVISGLAGNDQLHGVAGDDTLLGGLGNDRMDGGEGSDLYIISLAAEHTVAELADTGTTGIDEVRFTATSSGTLTLFAGDTGIERVVIGTGTGAVAVNTATTALNVNAAAVGNALWIIGNAGANTLTGTAFNDTLDGGAGNDKMTGGNGNDSYFVDSAGDSVTEASAAGGIDLVTASVSYTLGSNVENLALGGSSAINGTGNSLANVITGNSARNVIDGKAGVDTLDGADGGDLYVVGLSTDHSAAEFADSGSSGTDEVRFTATRAGTLTLFAGDVGIEQVTVGTGTGVAPVATGTTALNVNAAAVGNALTITGNAGVNILVGTAFNDTLVGGKGSDVLTGGAGADAFVFNFVPNTSNNRDTITDFTSGTDVLQLSKAIYTAISGAIGGLATEQFWSAPGAVTGHDADDRIVYNQTTGILYYDADGSGSGAAVQIALLGTSTHPALAFTDIVLIA